MQKLGLKQSLSQKLSPQQIQFVKLLQVPTAELASRIEEELEVNPALEEGKEEETDEYDISDGEEEEYKDEEISQEEPDINLDDYLNRDDYSYKMQGDGFDPNQEDKETPLAAGSSLQEQLLTQLGMLNLTEKQQIIGRQLIGSIESDGYLRREAEAIVNDLAFRQNVDCNEQEVLDMLGRIQRFDPPGIASRNLQECLSIQLHRKNASRPEIRVAQKIIDDCYTEFTKKHYEKLQRKIGEDEELIRGAIQQIMKLNPKPGSGAATSNRPVMYVIPDYILTEINGKLDLKLNGRNAPELRVSQKYSEMMDTYSKSDKKDTKMKEAVTFVKQKLDAAKWFIESIQQRQQTLLKTMHAILNYQKSFFLSGDESKLRPMILKDIAEIIHMDISTVSRVVNSKYIQTDFGVYSLKYFFSEGIATDSGEDASSKRLNTLFVNW